MSAIYLGDLSVDQIQARLGITLPPDAIAELNASRQQRADNIAPDKWHCFDIPLVIACGSMDMAVRVRDILSPHSGDMKESIQIAIDEGERA